MSNIKTRNLVIYCWTNEIDITERYIFWAFIVARHACLCGMARHIKKCDGATATGRQTKVFLFRSGRALGSLFFMYIYVGDVYLYMLYIDMSKIHDTNKI